MAYMTRGKTEVGLKPAPTTASFSSRGPNSIEEFILKVRFAIPSLAYLLFFPVFNFLMCHSGFNLSLISQHQGWT